MQVKSIAECSELLQYFWPSLSYHLSLSSLLSFFEWSLYRFYLKSERYQGLDLGRCCNATTPLPAALSDSAKTDVIFYSKQEIKVPSLNILGNLINSIPMLVNLILKLNASYD